jgi:hypothetical protein
MTDPMAHAHTAAPGPPVLIGLPNVAGTDPRTPRTDTAYEIVEYLVKCRDSS